MDTTPYSLHRYFIHRGEPVAVYRVRMRAGSWQGHYWDRSAAGWRENEDLVRRYWNGFDADVDAVAEEQAMGAILDSAWTASHPDPGWSWRQTPCFPREWPPAGRATLRTYAYAWAVDSKIADGVRMAAPWACIETGPDGSPRLEMLESVREIGIQSVWPLRPEEAEDFELQDIAEEYMKGLAAAPSEDQADAIRRFYGIWSRGNGVLLKEIRPQHAAFFDWLMNSMSPSKKS